MDMTKRTTQQRIIDTEKEFKGKYERVKEQLHADNRLNLSTLKRWECENWMETIVGWIFIFGKNMSFIHVFYW